VRLPAARRTNDEIRAAYPEAVAAAERDADASPWSVVRESPRSALFDAAMAPYARDAFRGAVERRVLGPGETSIDLERAAAEEALAAAGLAPSEVDLLVVCSFVPRHLGVGNAAFLARALRLDGAAWNLESACAGSLVALEVAAALVQTGRHRNALVVTSCNYSQTIDPRSVLAWTAGDGAAAFVVAPVAEGSGLLGGYTLHTGATADTFAFAAEPGATAGDVRLRMRAAPEAGDVLRETALTYVRTCCARAVDAAGVTLDGIDAVVVNTPTAWFSSFVASALGIPRSKLVDGYPLHANIGPALWPANLHLAARSGRLASGSHVLLYAVGSVSSASAQVLRWSDVALGPAPP